MRVSEVAAPIRLAVVNDYEVVVRGVAAMLEPYRDRIEVVELGADTEVVRQVDIALYDTFSRPALEEDNLDSVLQNPRVRRTVLYTWLLTPDLLEDARQRGVDAALPKSTGSQELVDALERIDAGEERLESFAEVTGSVGGWPGKDEGLTPRESEVIALITEGLSNNEIAERAYLSINSVKSYIRSAYRTMGVTTRSQAVLWGIDHGFARNRVRITKPHADSGT